MKNIYLIFMAVLALLVYPVHASLAQSAGTLNAFQMSQPAATTKKNLVWVDDMNRVWKMDSMTYAGFKDLQDSMAAIRAIMPTQDVIVTDGKVLASHTTGKDSLYLDQSQVMMAARAEDSIQSLKLILNGKANISEIPTNVSELVNDVPYLTSSALSPYVLSSNFTWSNLSGKPTIPAAQVNADWSSNSGVSQILNKPTLFDGQYASLSGKPNLFSGAYADLTGKPTLFDGAYASLTGKPTLFTQTQADLLYKPISYTPTKSDVGLSNVDNTSDANKPISTATQTALNGKLSAEVDGSVTNEIQTLSYNSGVLGISGGNTVNIPVPTTFTRGTGTVSSGAVTINATRGQITYASNILAAGTALITFTNNTITATSNIQLTINSLGNTMGVIPALYVRSQTTGSCVIAVSNLNLLSLLNTTFAIDFTVQN